MLPFIDDAIFFTASKSPLLAIGKPASITSTFSFSKIFAILSFSEGFIDAPGLCSPSLRVVSNITNFSLLFIIIFFCSFRIRSFSFPADSINIKNKTRERIYYC